MKQNARGQRAHRTLLLKCFKLKKHRPSGVVERLNNQAKGDRRTSYGLRAYRVLALALYRSPGHLPEPGLTLAIL